MPIQRRRKIVTRQGGERISSALSHLAMTIYYDDDYEEMSNITDSRELHDSSKDMVLVKIEKNKK